MNHSEILQGKEGRYKIEKTSPLAFGRSSVLFEGLNEAGLPVCIKLFRSSPRSSTGESLLQEFVRELSVQRNLRHPHILAIIDFGEDLVKDSGPFLVLPLCRGGNLRELMKGRQFIPPHEAVPLLQQVALAIDFAHQSGFIHGDIKPENILLSEDRSHAYLSDFAMSKYFAIEERISTAIDAFVGGSTAYLSPEQIAEGKQSPRSDIYSFAIVTYEMLAGQLPFDVSVPPFKQMQAKISGNLIDPVDPNPTLPLGTRKALLKGLSVDRNERPESAAEFCRMLVGHDSSQVEHGKNLARRFGDFWASLDRTNKVAIITATIAGIAAIIAAIIGIVPKLR